eukprot:CAMPEP_0117484082 /NCGR_PEP_ID=MMETSP0784-20121206/14279_1 /TAXON_ID=39447 /ORGANISM="" /LENGTH=131 /DNA_ID=CAMNT_0005278653 /DNA_START=146 /DNA_END=541 /DNA_ORIENTATION=-
MTTWRPSSHLLLDHRTVHGVWPRAFVPHDKKIGGGRSPGEQILLPFVEDVLVESLPTNCHIMCRLGAEEVAEDLLANRIRTAVLTRECVKPAEVLLVRFADVGHRRVLRFGRVLSHGHFARQPKRPLLRGL